jgi:lipocalin-like protein
MIRSRVSPIVGPLCVLMLAVGVAPAGQERRTTQLTIKGVWRVSEWTTTGPKGRHVRSPQPWFAVFTDRHYTFIGVTSEMPRPQLPAPPRRTDKQVADAFNRFVAAFGTYEAVGREALVITASGTSSNEKTLSAKRLVTLNPNDIGSSQTYTYRVEGGNTLWLTEGDAAEGSSRNPTTWRFERLE